MITHAMNVRSTSFFIMRRKGSLLRCLARCLLISASDQFIVILSAKNIIGTYSKAFKRLFFGIQKLGSFAISKISGECILIHFFVIHKILHFRSISSGWIKTNVFLFFMSDDVWKMLPFTPWKTLNFAAFIILNTFLNRGEIGEINTSTNYGIRNLFKNTQLFFLFFYLLYEI